MSTVPCKSCSAPIHSDHFACEYCGAAQRLPTDPTQELALVKEQAAVAQRLAANKGADMAVFWQGAFVPTTIDALRLALQMTMSSLPNTEDYAAAEQDKSRFGVVHARALALIDAIRFHSGATEAARAEALHHRRVAHDRAESLRVALRKGDASLVVIGAGCLATFPIVSANIGRASAVGYVVGVGIVAAGVYIRHVMLARRPFDDALFK